jgi:hypothetical protein
MATRLMRRILVDSARARRNQKRGGGVRITLDEGLLVTGDEPPDQFFRLRFTSLYTALPASTAASVSTVTPALPDCVVYS